MPTISKYLGLILMIFNVYYYLCDSSKLNIFQHKAGFLVSKMSSYNLNSLITEWNGGGGIKTLITSDPFL